MKDSIKKSYEDRKNASKLIELANGQAANRSWFAAQFMLRNHTSHSISVGDKVFDGLAVAFKAGAATFHYTSDYPIYEERVKKFVAKKAKLKVEKAQKPFGQNKLDQILAELSTIKAIVKKYE